mmetsp:Transcript_5882/g.10114  ORF Transcript_5882/g.10114 Transcript_5882/m.10114 type:complete len:218 (-) Transcript_5882:193-846(-)
MYEGRGRSRLGLGRWWLWSWSNCLRRWWCGSVVHHNRCWCRWRPRSRINSLSLIGRWRWGGLMDNWWRWRRWLLARSSSTFMCWKGRESIAWWLLDLCWESCTWRAAAAFAKDCWKGLGSSTTWRCHGHSRKCADVPRNSTSSCEGCVEAWRKFFQLGDHKFNTRLVRLSSGRTMHAHEELYQVLPVRGELLQDAHVSPGVSACHKLRYAITKALES